MVAGDGALSAPAGRSTIDGCTGEGSEALLHWYKAQCRFAVFEPVSRRQPVFPEPSQEWSAWYKSSLRPQGVVRSPSVGGDHPIVGRIAEYTIFDEELSDGGSERDDIFVQRYGYPLRSRPLLFVSTPLYNKCIGRVPVGISWGPSAKY